MYGSILALPKFSERYDFSSIRMCLSAGEALPARAWQAWKDATELEILDTIGCTETYHTFMANRPGAIRPGSSGKPIDGYDVCLVDDDGNPVPAGQVGNLMVLSLLAAVAAFSGVKLDDPGRTAKDIAVALDGAMLNVLAIGGGLGRCGFAVRLRGGVQRRSCAK